MYYTTSLIIDATTHIFRPVNLLYAKIINISSTLKIKMKHKYTAKIYFEDGNTIKQHGDKIEKLIAWMHSQSRERFIDINGEIIDNKTHRIIKNIQYSPLDD